MSKTFKDRNNYFSHHEVPEFIYARTNTKHKINSEDIPADVKNSIQYQLYGVSYRHGNNRKSIAKDKEVIRKKDKLDEIKIINHDLKFEGEV